MLKDEFDSTIKEINSYFATLSSENNLKRYLDTLARFQYSTYNTAMVQMQKPEASQVKGQKAWEKLERTVTDESGITILKPVMEEHKIPKIDPKTKEPLLDDKGSPIMTVKKELVDFEPIKIYDVSQTDGKPVLPAPKCDIDKLSEMLCENGSSETENKERALVLKLREMTHEELEQGAVSTQNMFRLQCAHYAVCEHFGLDTTRFSFGKCSEAINFNDPEKIKTELDAVCKASKNIINNIEEKYRERFHDNTEDIEEQAPEKNNIGQDFSDENKNVEDNDNEDILDLNNPELLKNNDTDDLFYQIDDLGDAHTDDTFSEIVKLRNELKAAQNKNAEQAKTIANLTGVINRTNAILNANPTLLSDFKAAKKAFENARVQDIKHPDKSVGKR